MGQAMTFTSRNGHLHLRKRVPRRFRRVETREYVWISLGTDSPSEAEEKAPRVWRQMVDAWEARLAGDTEDADRRFEAARALAKARGMRYLPVDRVAQLPLDELLERIERTVIDGRIDPIEADALLGLAEKPAFSLSKVLDEYWSLSKETERGKNADQIRRARNPRKKAFKNLISVIGNKDIGEVSRDDLLEFRDWLWDRIEAGELKPGSANRDITCLSAAVRTFERRKRLGLNLSIWSDLSFAREEITKRPSFSVAWIRTRLLAPGALDGLNSEARCALLGMINTGYRPSEGLGLLPHHIRLDGDIPHISIEPEGRALKTRRSRRIIPLVGVSLEAFQQCPEGFPRYRGKAGWSNTVNKFLRVNGLMESDDHVAFSLRHAFEDRMIAADIDDRIRRDLFGHRLNREEYGHGASLEKLAETLGKIAI